MPLVFRHWSDAHLPLVKPLASVGDNLSMSGVSSIDAAPGLVQIAMMAKLMDTARTQMSGLLQAMPQPAPASPTAHGPPGSLDLYL